MDAISLEILWVKISYPQSENKSGMRYFRRNALAADGHDEQVGGTGVNSDKTEEENGETAKKI